MFLNCGAETRLRVSNFNVVFQRNRDVSTDLSKVEHFIGSLSVSTVYVNNVPQFTAAGLWFLSQNFPVNRDSTEITTGHSAHQLISVFSGDPRKNGTGIVIIL